MLVTREPVLRRFWYPVLPVEQLVDGPQSFQLLGQPLVLWLTEIPQNHLPQRAHASDFLLSYAH